MATISGHSPPPRFRDNDNLSTRNEALPGSFARAGFFIAPGSWVSQGREQVAITVDR